MQELDGHTSFVNSVCFDDEGTKLFSADGVGKIRVWNVYVTDQPSKRGEAGRPGFMSLVARFLSCLCAVCFVTFSFIFVVFFYSGKNSGT